MKKLLTVGLITAMAASFVGCGNTSSDATVVSRNLSTAADNFEIDRRIVFYNGITGDYVYNVEGKCSFEVASDRKIDVTCKTGPNEYKKHTLGVADNITYFSEQLSPKGVSNYHYRIIYKPTSIIPDMEIK